MQAQHVKRGNNLAVEILVGIVVTAVSFASKMLFIYPVRLLALLTRDDYRQALKWKDSAGLYEIGSQFEKTDAALLINLFSFVMTIAVILLFCRIFQKRSMRTAGFCRQRALKEYFGGLILGTAAFSVVVILGLLSGGLTYVGTAEEIKVEMLVLFFLGFMVQGMAEEVLCRGYLLVSVLRRYPLAVGILVNSFFFAALHLGNTGMTILAFANMVLYGILASVYFLKRGNIWGIAAFHAAWNFAQGNLYGIKVSGITVGQTVLVFQPLENKAALNGGAYGLEGSLWTTLIFTAVTAIVYLIPIRAQTEKGDRK